MTLRSVIADDATAVFLNTDEFAETVTYIPYNFPGQTVRANRSITAVVVRQQLVAENDVPLYVYEVHVANDSTDGISSAELDVTRDRMELPKRDGKDAVRVTVMAIVAQDHGMMILECK